MSGKALELLSLMESSMDDLLARYRHRDKAMRIGGAIILLALIAILMLPDKTADPDSAPHSQIALFEPARGGPADSLAEGTHAERARIAQ
jgi:hypothetical protein